MKKFFALLPGMLCFLLILVFQRAEAQILKRIKDEVKTRTERKVVNKAGDAVDRTIDNAVDGIGGKSGSSSGASAPSEGDGPAPAPAAGSYKSYDFVAGDKIIFQPDLSTEADAELPARYIIYRGNAEVQSYEGEKILHLDAQGYASVGPLMSSESYLPEQYTIEFDMMYENSASYFQFVNDFKVEFRKAEDTKNAASPLFIFDIVSNSRVHFGDANAGDVELNDALKKSVQTNTLWHHIAIYVRKNIGKAYIDQYRVAATNTLPVGAVRFNLTTDRYGIKIRNMRVAAGGDDKYNRIVTEGKFVTHGILFDVGKSSIRPESTGALNEIVKLMKEHEDLHFEIDGHTDSDGKPEANLKLSQERADAVKARLVEMGIDGSRLTTRGFGASKPIDKNNSAEGKANNRRVEFVKV